MMYLKLFEHFIDSDILDIEDYLLELIDDKILVKSHGFMVVNDFDNNGDEHIKIKSIYVIKKPEPIDSLDDLEKLSILYKRIKGCISRSKTPIEFKLVNDSLNLYLNPKDNIAKLFKNLDEPRSGGYLYKGIDGIELNVYFGKIHDDMSMEINVNGGRDIDARLISEMENIQKLIIDKFTKEYNLKFIEISNQAFVKKLFRFTS